jgi:magnesium transporter
MENDLELARVFMESHPDAAALSMEQLPGEDVTALLSEVPPEIAAAVLVRMAPYFAVACLVSLPVEFAAKLLGIMPRDHSALVLRRMRAGERNRLLDAAPARVATTLAVLLRFPENTAGALMDPEVVALPQDVGAGEALDRVRNSGARIFYYIYVVDRARKLAGVVNLRELIEASEDKLLEEIMQRQVSRLTVHADLIEMRAHPGWREFYALPVVDDQGMLAGVLRYKTLRANVPDDTLAPRAANSFAAGIELGELYWNTMGQLLQTMWPQTELDNTPKPEKTDGR